MIYEACITRIAIGFKTFSVEANSEEEAKEKAMYLARNVTFHTTSTDYEVEHIQETEEINH